MMEWFRFYHDAVDDPKVQRLSPQLFKHWINLLCLASRNCERGALPSVADLAFGLRLSETKVRAIMADLESAGLIDRDGETLLMHGWANRQKRSDNVSERVAKHRASNAPVTLHETLPHVRATETETETEKRNTPPTPSRGKRKTPLTDLPDDFAVTDDMRRWAKDRHRLTDAQIDAKTERFLNYVGKTGKQYANWTLAWRDAMTWEERAVRPVDPNAGGRGQWVG